MMSTKMRPDTWDNIDRNTKLAYVMYPAQAPQWAQNEMRRLSALEGKQVPTGLPEPTPTASKPYVGPRDYSRVPGLVRKR